MEVIHGERLKILSPHRQIVRKSGNPKSSNVSFLHTCVAISQNELIVRFNSIELGTFAAVMAPSKLEGVGYTLLQHPSIEFIILATHTRLVPIVQLSMHDFCSILLDEGAKPAYS